MNKKKEKLIKKLNKITSIVLDNVNENNIDIVYNLCNNFESNLKKKLVKIKIIKKPPIWTKFSDMTEEDIRKEFNNTKKYPDLESIKSAVKGYIELKKVSKVKTRETLIKHIIDTYNRGSFISKIIGAETEKRV